MKKICVVSGKGGVGKSTITASLSLILSKKYNIVCADCDVDASNLSLLLGKEESINQKRLSTNEIAKIDYSNCNNCGRCAQACYFNAIQFEQRSTIIEEKCEGCGTCKLVCKNNAITLEAVENATIQKMTTTFGFDVVSAQLDMGKGGSGKIVNEVKNITGYYDADLMLIDCPAGTGCPVIASVNDCDYAVIVTEPSKTAFSDMKRAIKILRHFDIPFGAVLNKADINPAQKSVFYQFFKQENIEIIEQIGYNDAFKESLIAGQPAIAYEPLLKNNFNRIGNHIITYI
ncbi:MAG: P-loop NTPase [Candidatus Nanoarchaeia archaeon]